MGRPSVVCLSSVTFVRPAQGAELFGNIFASPKAQGLGQFVLQFKTESRRDSRGSFELEKGY